MEVPNDDVHKDAYPEEELPVVFPKDKALIEEIIEKEITRFIPKQSEEEIKLDQARKGVKDKYPELVFEENRGFIDKFRSYIKCSTCRSYTRQSKMSDIKSKIRGAKTLDNRGFMLRIYKNSAEKLEDAKGYCCVAFIGAGFTPNKHNKTMIPVPETSGCSDHELDPILQQLCTLVMKKINKEERAERLQLEKMTKAMKQKEEAIKLINDIDEEYNDQPFEDDKKKIRGSDPSNRTF